MAALIFVGILLWLSWEMAHGGDIRSAEFWKAKRQGLLVGNPFRKLLVIFCLLSVIVLYASVYQAVAEAPTALVGLVAALFLGVGGTGLWATLRRR